MRFEVKDHSSVEDSGFTATGPTVVRFTLFDFRIDYYRFLASYHHLRICPRIYVRSSHFRHLFVPADLFPTH